MNSKPQLPFFTLLLMISFASVNAVLFTPALPNIASIFAISNGVAQYTITWFLVGYALGQLIYGPLANRFGRKPALLAGIGLQIISSFICVSAGMLHVYAVLVIGRFLLALGAGVGLKMTFTLVSDCYEPKVASQKISYLMAAFAITPGLGVALGGILNAHFGWMSCFYAGALYGLVLLLLALQLPETQKTLHLDAFKISHLIHGYAAPFKNKQLMGGGFLMGCATAFFYVFAAVAPFVAINHFGLNSAQYGLANILPPIGLFSGSLVSARLVKIISLNAIIQLGILILTVSGLLMFAAIVMHLSVLYLLFLPAMVAYFGLCLILANASTLAMSHVNDKAHGSAVMNFMNIGITTLVVLNLGFFPITLWLMPSVYVGIGVVMMVVYAWVKKSGDRVEQEVRG